MSKSGHPRYFIGIALPSELSQQLFLLKWRLHNNTPRSLKPLVPHITLLHPSSLDAVDRDFFLEQAKNAAQSHLPLEITLETIDHFANEVLYLRVASPGIIELQHALTTLLPEEAQASYRERPYIPHSTLLQVKRPDSITIDQFESEVKAVVSLPMTFTPSSIACFTQQAPREYSIDTL